MEANSGSFKCLANLLYTSKPFGSSEISWKIAGVPFYKERGSIFQVPTKLKFSNVKGHPGQGKADVIRGIDIVVGDRKAGRLET